jgi:cytochrome P450
VTYQTAWDFLDSTSERGASAGVENGSQLHIALADALNPSVEVADHYRYHPWKDDCDYLKQLIEACRHSCLQLPAYADVRQLILPDVTRCAVQSLNHVPCSGPRDAALKAWAERELPDQKDLSWFERCAAASAFTPHPMLALAAERTGKAREKHCIYSVYFPWVALAIAMLDSYVDQAKDSANGDHSYIAHYETPELALRRIHLITTRAIRGARELHDGHRHTLIVAAMIAMYLSSGNASYTLEMRNRTRGLANAGGVVTKMLLPVLRCWRTLHLRPSRAHLDEPSSRTSGLPPCLPLPKIVQTLALWQLPYRYMTHIHSRQHTRYTIHSIGQPPLVILSDPQEVKTVLTAPADVLHPGKGVITIMPLVGDESFMLMDEEKHLPGRKAILPAFRPEAVQEHAESVTGIVRNRVRSWPRGSPVALHPYLRELTLEVILRHIFLPSALSDGYLEKLHRALLAMLSIADSTILPAPLLRHDPRRPIWTRFLRHREEVDDLLYALIDSHQSTPGSTDVLNRLSQTPNANGKPMSRQQKRDNIMSLVLAGHETTAAELAWALHLLAHNPRVQQKLIAEVHRGENESYLEATVLEVLRHRPVFPFAIPRAVVAPVEVGDWTYHPPAHLLGCIHLVHHDPSIYRQPEQFRPERFLNAPPQPHLWVPWGGGRKRCPGARLAVLEIKAVLRTVLSDVRVLPAGRRVERPRWRSVIVTPHAGGRVVLEAHGRPAQRPAKPSREAKDHATAGVAA